jgi:hypothetical protein
VFLKTRRKAQTRTERCVSAWKSDPVFGVIGVQN